jgi:oligopeptide transport system permease protein
MSEPLADEVASEVEGVATDSPRTVSRAEAEANDTRIHGVWIDAWRILRRKPLFLISLGVIVILTVMAVAPALFASGDPNKGTLSYSLQGPSAAGWFGFDVNGRNVYTRVIYGARASLTVGLACTVGTGLIGILFGSIAAYSGGAVDSVISRIGDMLLGIPFALAAIIVLSTLTTFDTANWQVEIILILTIIIFGWPSIARVLRSTVLVTRNADYVVAGQALGLSGSRILFRHILPNAVSPILVLSTMRVGGYIATEASLSYLGLGLHPPAVSWGQMVSDGQPYLRTGFHVLLFPSIFLAITILAFVLAGEALREALDPANRK